MKTRINPRRSKGAAAVFLSFIGLTLFALPLLAAPLTGTLNIPGAYPDLATAISDLNAQGVGAGGVTLNLLPLNPQVAPPGGYVVGDIGSLVLTTSSAANPVILQGNGNTITASATLVSGKLNDGIFKLMGADWITITGFTLVENAQNTITTYFINNTTEWGVALLYATPTDGCQNDTIQDNMIDLIRTNPSAFGIYSNSTHTATVTATIATATGPNGGNHNLRIYGNYISDVSNGIIVIGPAGAADQNDGLDIGGTTADTGNVITDFGYSSTASNFANLDSNSANGITVRNTKNYNISGNTVSSFNGAVINEIFGALGGIQVLASSNAPIGTLTQTINRNSISLRCAFDRGVMGGIGVSGQSVNPTTSVSVNDNDFNNFGHTVAVASGSIGFIFVGGIFGQGSVPMSTTMDGNTFTNISVHTTGVITFFSSGASPNPMLAGTSISISGNSILGGFTRTATGTTTTVWRSVAPSVNGSLHVIQNNDFSNITLAGSSQFNGIIEKYGASATSGSTKRIIGNTFTNITASAGYVEPINVDLAGIGTIVSDNTITDITVAAAISCLQLGSSIQGTVSVSGNTIGQIISGGNSLVGISSGSTTALISKNKIYDLSGTAAGSVVSGIAISGNTPSSETTVQNNLMGNLTAPAATSLNGVMGISITGSGFPSTYNVYDNTIYLNNPTSGLGFGSSGLSVPANGAQTARLDLRNNIIVNTSVQSGGGLTVAYRRNGGSILANYASTSNNNSFYAGTPSATNLIYYDGTSSAQTIGAYKNGVFPGGPIAPRDSASFSENPPFLSTSGLSAAFLHIDPAIATQIESGAMPIGGIVDDFDGDTRNLTTPDVGADELDGLPPTATPTPTPISTVTPTPTATSTPTSTPAATSTPTPTPTPTVINISGTVTYCPDSSPVQGVTLTLTGSASGSTLSGGSGNYALSGVSGGSYTVTPTKDALTPGSIGINTLDVIATQRHFLLLGTPLSGCQLTAANVNGIAGIDTVDVIAIQRFFLGLSTGIANVGKYQFAPASRTYPAVVSDQTSQDYATLIFGDVIGMFADRAAGGPSQDADFAGAQAKSNFVKMLKR